jgi:hypothetical protein
VSALLAQETLAEKLSMVDLLVRTACFVKMKKKTITTKATVMN